MGIAKEEQDRQTPAFLGRMLIQKNEEKELMQTQAKGKKFVGFVFNIKPSLDLPVMPIVLLIWHGNRKPEMVGGDSIKATLMILGIADLHCKKALGGMTWEKQIDETRASDIAYQDPICCSKRRMHVGLQIIA